MSVSVCITVFNEKKSVSKLLESLLKQTRKPDEIVVVDGGSTDKTVEIIRHYQKKDRRIKLLIERCTRARGRNLAVELAKYEIVAITDADCVAEIDWLNRLIEPFKHEDVDICGGFYEMKAESDFQKAESCFLGVLPSKFDASFLPSTRSMAFRKRVWEELGGFPERDGNSAEDTDFNYEAIKRRYKFARIKEARVLWSVPEIYEEFVRKIYNYAMWDAKYGVWWHPLKCFESHNIRAVLKILRYFLGITLFILGFYFSFFWFLLFFGILVYMLWAFRKVFVEFQDLRVGLWGIVLQFTSDFAVTAGFFKGLLAKNL